MTDEFDGLLQKLGEMAAIENELYKSVDECGEFVRDDARLRAPVDIGDLRKSIAHTTEKKADEITAIVHTNSDHAMYVEFGTGPVGASNHKGVSPNVDIDYATEKWLGQIPFLISATDSGYRYIAGQAAQPYLYPALKDNEEQIENKLKADIGKIIKEHCI